MVSSLARWQMAHRPIWNVYMLALKLFSSLFAYNLERMWGQEIFWYGILSFEVSLVGFVILDTYFVSFLDIVTINNKDVFF